MTNAEQGNIDRDNCRTETIRELFGGNPDRDLLIELDRVALDEGPGFHPLLTASRRNALLGDLEELLARIRRRRTIQQPDYSHLRHLAIRNEEDRTIEQDLGSSGQSEVGRRPSTWWMPSLAILAYQALGDDTRQDSRPAIELRRFAASRPQLSYMVVEEFTDDVVGLTISSWPIVDEAGALRFDTTMDPFQMEMPVQHLQNWINSGRERWWEAGLGQDRLVRHPISYGDVFAAQLQAYDPTGRTRNTSPYLWDQIHEDPEFVLPDPHDPDVVVVDVSWDARQAAKLAHFAAAGQITAADEEFDAAHGFAQQALDDDEHDARDLAAADEVDSQHRLQEEWSEIRVEQEGHGQ